MCVCLYRACSMSLPIRSFPAFSPTPSLRVFVACARTASARSARLPALSTPRPPFLSRLPSSVACWKYRGCVPPPAR